MDQARSIHDSLATSSRRLFEATMQIDCCDKVLEDALESVAVDARADLRAAAAE